MYAYFVQVHDWIGSLSLEPENFQLKDHITQGHIINPDNIVFSGALNMIETENALLMSPNGSVAFQGFTMAQEDNFSTSDEEPKATRSREK